MNHIHIEFLKSFFNLFNADISITEIRNAMEYYGLVKWDEQNVQPVKWVNIFHDHALEAAADLCDFLLSNRLVDSDKITVTEPELYNLLQHEWPEAKIRIAIDCLLCIDIKMIDCGKETDSFYIHF